MHWSIYRRKNLSVEEICYDSDHIKAVLSALKKNFVPAFEKFVDFNAAKNFVKIISDAVTEFESDCNRYREIFDAEAFDEYFDDPNNFKSDVLKNKCPVIRKTLKSKLDELKQYKVSFKLADPNELLEKISNICAFGREYFSRYDAATYESAKTFADLKMATLDSDECSVSGVVGAGIKSHFLYKLYPAIFPVENQSSIWSLYFLSGQEDFGCEYGSEFLMIDDTDFVTRQNYSYPYELFAYYAFELYKLLEHEANKINLSPEKTYRYVLVYAFLSNVAETHSDEINVFKRQIPKGGLGYGWS